MCTRAGAVEPRQSRRRLGGARWSMQKGGSQIETSNDQVLKTAADHSVLIIGSEAVPFAKTGGLGDVLGALPQAIARLGWLVTLVLPRYRGVGDGTLVERFAVPLGGSVFDVGVYEAPVARGARALLIE